MRIKDLEYFLKLTELNNVTQVAQFFSISQPTITYAIKRLESELGITLVQRNPQHHSISITTAGTQFSLHAKEIMVELARAEYEIQNLSESKISLGLPPIIGNFYFPKFIPKLAKLGLISKLKTDSSGSEEILSELLSGKINIALIGTSSPIQSDDLHLSLLSKSPFTIVTGSNKNDIQLPAKISFAQAAEYPFIVFDEGFVHNKAFSYFTHSAGVSARIMYQTTEIGILKEMVRYNAGIALLTSLAVVNQDGLISHQLLDSGDLSFNIYLAYRRNYQLSADEQTFVNVFREQKLSPKSSET